VRSLISGREATSTGLATGLGGGTRSGMTPVKLVSAISITARLPSWLTCSLTGWVRVKRNVLPSASVRPPDNTRGMAAATWAGSKLVLALKVMASTPPVVVALILESVEKDRRPKPS
jgi:hypothetical protein